MKQKGIYTYKYRNSFKKFNEERLTNKKSFSSSVKDKDYEYVKRSVE